MINIINPRLKINQHYTLAGVIGATENDGRRVRICLDGQFVWKERKNAKTTIGLPVRRIAVQYQ